MNPWFSAFIRVVTALPRQRWFWLLVLSIGGLFYSGFWLLQIFGAVFLVLSVLGFLFLVAFDKSLGEADPSNFDPPQSLIEEMNEKLRNETGRA